MVKSQGRKAYRVREFLCWFKDDFCCFLFSDHRVWTFRRNLSFTVNSLLYYLQVDVIEAQFCVLLKAVKDANEFEDIIKVHTQFLTDLLTKTFVMELDDVSGYLAALNRFFTFFIF